MNQRSVRSMEYRFSVTVITRHGTVRFALKNGSKNTENQENQRNNMHNQHCDIWKCEHKEEPYSRRDHVHCPEKDSPCGMKGKHPCCLCGKEPQEEPKCPIGHSSEAVCSSCPKKESESKECDCGNGSDCVCRLLETDLSKFSPYKNHIVLEKPANMSIGEALKSFGKYLEEEWPTNGDERISNFKNSDERFIKLWQEWLSTKK